VIFTIHRSKDSENSSSPEATPQHNEAGSGQPDEEEPQDEGQRAADIAEAERARRYRELARHYGELARHYKELAVEESSGDSAL
jgi:hypothetical protein